MKLSAFFFSSVAIVAVSSAAVSDVSENNELIRVRVGVAAAATAVDGESVKAAAPAHNKVLRGAIKAIAEGNSIAVGKLCLSEFCRCLSSSQHHVR